MLFKNQNKYYVYSLHQRHFYHLVTLSSLPLFIAIHVFFFIISISSCGTLMISFYLYELLLLYISITYKKFFNKWNESIYKNKIKNNIFFLFLKKCVYILCILYFCYKLYNLRIHVDTLISVLKNFSNFENITESLSSIQYLSTQETRYNGKNFQRFKEDYREFRKIAKETRILDIVLSRPYLNQSMYVGYIITSAGLVGTLGCVSRLDVIHTNCVNIMVQNPLLYDRYIINFLEGGVENYYKIPKFVLQPLLAQGGLTNLDFIILGGTVSLLTVGGIILIVNNYKYLTTPNPMDVKKTVELRKELKKKDFEEEQERRRLSNDDEQDPF